MREFRFTLLGDGSSDATLIPLLTWLLREHGMECAIQSEWADLRWLRIPARRLSERIKGGIDLYPCDLLFVHRDAERSSPEDRKQEILQALEIASQEIDISPTICVIPVRMQETWFLFDEKALRRAAGNPSGRQSLNLPPINTLENIPDPKGRLHELLRAASGLSGRRRNRVPVRSHSRRVAELIEDFSPLRALPAFQALEAELVQVLDQQKWRSVS